MISWVPPVSLSLGQFPLLFPQQSFCSLWSLSLLSILLRKLRSAVAGCLLLSDPRLDLRIRVIPPPTPTSSNLQLSPFHWTFFFGYKYVFNEKVFHKKKMARKKQSHTCLVTKSQWHAHLFPSQCLVGIAFACPPPISPQPSVSPHGTEPALARPWWRPGAGACQASVAWSHCSIPQVESPLFEMLCSLNFVGTPSPSSVSFY